MKRVRAFLADPSGVSAAEFALVLPVALLFLLGIIDIGRYAWAMNRLEKAVQVGTRYAVVTAVVPTNLATTSYVGFNCGAGALVAGQQICKDALGTITCRTSGTAVACSCVATSLAGSCPASLSSVNTAAFNNIVARMRLIAPSIGTNNVSVSYSGSGIGYAGDPATDDSGNALSDISPIVTVQLSSMRLRSFSLLGFGIRLPSFQYSQTLEDGEGAKAY
jgi:Flp pilus assembly protein TadG